MSESPTPPADPEPGPGTTPSYGTPPTPPSSAPPAQPYAPAQPYPPPQSYPPDQPHPPAQPYPSQAHPGRPYPGHAYPATGYASEQLSASDARTWGMLAHLSAIIASFLGLSFLGPLVVWLVYKDRSDFVRRHAVEALNFQITLWIAGLAGVVITLVTLGIGAIVVVPLAIVVSIAALVLMIIAAVTANRGEPYRYPATLRLVK